MLTSIIAMETHGDKHHALAMTFSVPSASFDLLRAVRCASQAFCHSAKSGICHNYNHEHMSWFDFCEHVPIQFQQRYNFQLISYYDMGETTILRNLSENLMHADNT